MLRRVSLFLLASPCLGEPPRLVRQFSRTNFTAANIEAAGKMYKAAAAFHVRNILETETSKLRSVVSTTRSSGVNAYRSCITEM
jgi:hypothetical protein